MGEGVNPHPVTPNSVTPSPPHPGLRGARCTRFIPPAACRGGVDNVARGRGVEAGGLEGIGVPRNEPNFRTPEWPGVAGAGWSVAGDGSVFGGL